jgi:hypothetical protein
MYKRQQDQVEQQELLKRNVERELVKEENYRNVKPFSR